MALRQALVEERERAVVAETYAASLDEERHAARGRDRAPAGAGARPPLAGAVSALEPSDRAPGLLVAPGVSIAADAEIGANVVIHAGVVIEGGCRIQDGAVLGKLPVLGPHTTSPRAAADVETRLERGAQVGCYVVIVAGASIGPQAVVADHALVREHARLEAGAVAGHGGVLGRGCRLGARSKLMGGFILAPLTVIEEDVFCGPGLTVTDDLTMGRHRGVSELPAVTLRRACRVAANVTLLPGLEIGEEAVVGAGSVVTRDVGARTVVLGSPARFVRDVTDAELRGTPPSLGRAASASATAPPGSGR